ncbi:MAG: hypothetical protein AB1894_29780 [Chloroflexota bacterium]
MVEVKITLKLPDQLAQEAQRAGLLSAGAIEALLNEEIRRRNVDKFFAAADRLSASDPAPFSMADIQAEIQAARQERHKRADRR